jgi:hypothetical protein
MFFTGTATANVGGAAEVVDTGGLTVYTEANALVGGWCYVRTAGGAAPEEESRRISASDGTDSFTVAPAFSAAVDVGDTYELYLCPLTIAQWDLAINRAINAAWPQVWAREYWSTPAAEIGPYSLPDAVAEVLEVEVVPRGALAGLPAQPIPMGLWRTTGTPGTDLMLRLERTVPEQGRDLGITYRAKYAELAAGESTDLDPPYLLLAGAAWAYDALAAEAGSQAASQRFLQLFDYYEGLAEQRRRVLESELLGLAPDQKYKSEGRKK